MIIWFLTLALGKSLKIMVVDETLGIPSHDIHETQDTQHCPPGTLSDSGLLRVKEELRVLFKKNSIRS